MGANGGGNRKPTGGGSAVFGKPALAAESGRYPPGWLLYVALAILPVIAFLPAMWGVYIWDDSYWLVNCAVVHDLHRFTEIWTNPAVTPHYYPLVFTTFSLEWALWGAGVTDAGGELRGIGYHVDNLALHIFSALMLFKIIKSLRLPGGVGAAWLAAAIWAIHPMNVESVAWVAERKNVLCAAMLFPGFFFLMRFYGIFNGEEAASAPTGRKRDYGLALLFFLLSLLAKTAGCFLPPAMLVLIWWRRGRITRREIAWSVPFFVIGIVLGAFTMRLEAQHAGAMGPEWAFGWSQRVVIAGMDCWFYVGKLLWPFPVMQIYPRFAIEAGKPLADKMLFAAPALWAALGAALFLGRKKLSRGPLAAYLLFSGAMFPVLGFISFYTMIYTFVADHYQYLAGPFFILPVVEAFAWAGRMLVPKVGRMQGVSALRIIQRALAVAALGGCAAISYWISGLYLNGEQLWGFNALYNPRSVFVLCQVADFKIDARSPDLDGAAEFINLALRVDPNDWLAYQTASEMYFRVHDLADAVDNLRKAEAHMPQMELESRQHHRRDLIDAKAHQASMVRPELEAGRKLELSQQWDKAVTFYQEFIKTHPGDIDARLRLGYCLQHGKLDFEGAAKVYREAIALKADSAEAWLFLGFALRDMKLEAEAVSAFQKATALDPNVMNGHPELLDPDG